jgi:hypothetical protein
MPSEPYRGIDGDLNTTLLGGFAWLLSHSHKPVMMYSSFTSASTTRVGQFRRIAGCFPGTFQPDLGRPQAHNPKPTTGSFPVTTPPDNAGPTLVGTSYTRQSRSPLEPWLPLLRLMRLPNVFTALADVLMGFVFARHSFRPAWC